MGHQVIFRPEVHLPTFDLARADWDPPTLYNRDGMHRRPVVGIAERGALLSENCVHVGF